MYSYQNTTNHSDADCRAIKNTNGNAHVASAQHTCTQGTCSGRDIPDPKEDSERPFIFFSATEVTSSAATTTSKQEKGTWPFGPSPTMCPWPLAEREKLVIDSGRQSQHDLTYMFDTDAKGDRSTVGPLCNHQHPSPTTTPVTAAISSMSWSTAEYRITTDDFLIPELNRRLLDYTCLTTPRKILPARGVLLDGTGEGIVQGVITDSYCNGYLRS